MTKRNSASSQRFTVWDMEKNQRFGIGKLTMSWDIVDTFGLLIWRRERSDFERKTLMRLSEEGGHGFETETEFGSCVARRTRLTVSLLEVFLSYLHPYMHSLDVSLYGGGPTYSLPNSCIVSLVNVRLDHLRENFWNSRSRCGWPRCGTLGILWGS